MNEIQGYLIVRDEVDIIDEVISYYHSCGVPILVIDNGSSDGTEDILNSWARKGAIEVIAHPTADYDLKALLEMTVDLASRKTDGWLLHIDADHFYDPPLGVSDLLELSRRATQEGANVVNFVECTFFHTALDPNPAEEPSVQRRQRFYRRHVGGLNQPRLFRSLTGVDVHSDGGHSVVFRDRPVKWFSQHGILRHYPFRSFEQGRKKLAARLARYSEAGKSRNWHQQYTGLKPDGWFIPDPHNIDLKVWVTGQRVE